MSGIELRLEKFSLRFIQFLFTMEVIREMFQFLEPSARLDLKIVALQHVLGLTGSNEGLELLSSLPEIVRIRCNR